ncbi:MAG TPA: selenide, water dikinase SelD, partial [Candidatus Angelobacter sp.]|nr:selenide, water dikinase SelD [Candidatus Angelobacter sp.]
VTGMIHPERVWTNSGAKPGDKLILTKPLGTGVISTAIKKGEAKQEWIETATKSMTTLNAKAARIAAGDRFAIHAATDITGFGLIGHGREMAAGSEVSLHIESSRVGALPGALECIRAKFIPGGLNANRDFAECMVEYGEGVSEERRSLLFDPQTAGGLLLSVSPEQTPELIAALRQAGVAANEIGEVLPQAKPLIRVD